MKPYQITSFNYQFAPFVINNGGLVYQGPDNGTSTNLLRGSNAIEIIPSRTAVTQIASGANSITIGNNSYSSASGAIAIGNNTYSTGTNSTAIGNSSGASGNNVAIGNSVLAGNGSNSVVIGSSINVTGTSYNVIIGSGATSGNNNGVAIGYAANAYSLQGTAVGSNTYAYFYAVALGYGAVTTSSQYAISIGYGATCSAANYGIALGYGTTVSGTNGLGTHTVNTNSITGYYAFGHASGTAGRYQRSEILLQLNTTSTTATALTSDGAAAAATNQLTLRNNSAFRPGQIDIVGYDTVAGTACAFTITGVLIKQGANAASTALIGTPTVTTVQNNMAVAPTVTVLADTTNGALQIKVASGSTNSTNYTAIIRTAEVSA